MSSRSINLQLVYYFPSQPHTGRKCDRSSAHDPFICVVENMHEVPTICWRHVDDFSISLFRGPHLVIYGKGVSCFLYNKTSKCRTNTGKKKRTLSDKLFVLEPELYLNSYSTVQVSI